MGGASEPSHADIIARQDRMEGRLDRMEARQDAHWHRMEADMKAIRSKTDRASGAIALLLICLPTALGALFGWWLKS